MKTLNNLLLIFVCLSIGLMVSCSQEENLIESPDDSNFERAIIEKVGDEKANEILDQMSNPMRAPIVYNGELCPGVVNSGVAVQQGFPFFSYADFWYFSADAGDIITIEVDRVNCEMDPTMALYEGFGDDSTLVFVTWDDDGDLPACEPDCYSFDDPLLIDFILPSTGVYTVAVWDFFSCSSDPMAYNVVVSGHNQCSNTDTGLIVIDGCDTGVANQTLPDGNTMQGQIDTCTSEANNHGGFVSCVTHLTNDWKNSGLISREEKGRIQSCAAGSDIP